MAPTPVAARRRLDAQLASLAIEHGTGICSFERATSPYSTVGAGSIPTGGDVHSAARAAA
jgi:hypothetical protein